MHLELIHSSYGYALLATGIAGVIAGLIANGFLGARDPWHRLPAAVVWFVGIAALAMLAAVLIPAVHPVYFLAIGALLSIIAPQILPASDPPE